MAGVGGAVLQDILVSYFILSIAPYEWPWNQSPVPEEVPGPEKGKKLSKIIQPDTDEKPKPPGSDQT